MVGFHRICHQQFHAPVMNSAQPSDSALVCRTQIRRLRFHTPGAQGAGAAPPIRAGPLGPEQAALVAAADTFFIATHFCSPGGQAPQGQRTPEAVALGALMSKLVLQAGMPCIVPACSIMQTRP